MTILKSGNLPFPQVELSEIKLTKGNIKNDVQMTNLIQIMI